jgi:nucleoid DNA-binding protein
MQYSTYIKDLLYRYECVIIPGFGAFITHFHSAKIDANKSIFFPPGKTISFNQQLQTNDGLLANYVASTENCSYEQALKKVRLYAATLSSKLREEKSVVLENIGVFTINNDSKIEFHPKEDQNFYTGSFGLTRFVSTPVIREIYNQQAKQEEHKLQTLSPSNTKTTPYLKYAAVGLIAIAISGFGGIKLYEKNIQEHNFTQRQKANSLVENKIQEATFVIDNPLPAVKITLPKQKGKYHIIAGAFRVSNNASKKVQQLTKKGYPAILVGKNKYGLHQVAYQSFEKRQEALKALRAIKAKENPNAWLLVQPLDN